MTPKEKALIEAALNWYRQTWVLAKPRRKAWFDCLPRLEDATNALYKERFGEVELRGFVPERHRPKRSRSR